MRNLIAQLVAIRATAPAPADTSARVWVPQPDDYDQLATRIEQATKRQQARDAWLAKYGFDDTLAF